LTIIPYLSFFTWKCTSIASFLTGITIATAFFTFSSGGISVIAWRAISASNCAWISTHGLGGILSFRTYFCGIFFYTFSSCRLVITVSFLAWVGTIALRFTILATCAAWYAFCTIWIRMILASWAFIYSTMSNILCCSN